MVHTCDEKALRLVTFTALSASPLAEPRDLAFLSPESQLLQARPFRELTLSATTAMARGRSVPGVRYRRRGKSLVPR